MIPTKRILDEHQFSGGTLTIGSGVVFLEGDGNNPMFLSINGLQNHTSQYSLFSLIFSANHYILSIFWVSFCQNVKHIFSLFFLILSIFSGHF